MCAMRRNARVCMYMMSVGRVFAELFFGRGEWIIDLSITVFSSASPHDGDSLEAHLMHVRRTSSDLSVSLLSFFRNLNDIHHSHTHTHTKYDDGS